MPPDESLIRQLEAGWQAIAADRFAQRFYEILFDRHPQIRSMFPAELTAQYAKLRASLELVVAHLRSPGIVRRLLQDLGQRHARLGVRPEHYPMIIDALGEAMARCGGPVWTDKMRHDWTEALRLVADIMIEGGDEAAADAVRSGP